MTKCVLAVFLLLALAGQACAAEMIRVSVPPLVELEHPSSFLRQPNDDKDDIDLGALKDANPEGKGLKAPLKWHVPLLTLRHEGQDWAGVSLVAVPTIEQFTQAIEGDEQALRGFTELMGDGMRDTFEQMGWSMVQAMAGKRITLRDGRTVLELTCSFRVTGGGIQNYRHIYFPSRHYVINAVVATLPDVQPSTLAEIDSIIHSVRLLADEPVAGSGQGGTKAKAANGLIRFAEPRTIELAYPETFAPDEKEMRAAADKVNEGERLLLLLVHRDPEAAEVAVVLGDPSEGMTQETSSDYTVEELSETVERSTQKQIEIYAKQGGILHRPLRARNLTLPGGVKATNFEHQERTKDGTLYDRRSIEIYTDRFFLNVYITTSPKVAASTLADIETLVNSIQFYAGAEKIFTPATWPVAEQSSTAEPPVDGGKAATTPPVTAPPATVVEPWPKPPVGDAPGASSWSGGGAGWSSPAPGGYSRPVHFTGVFSSIGSLLLALLMAASHYGSTRARRREKAEYFYLYLLGYYLLLWPVFASLELLVGGADVTMLVGFLVLALLLFFPPGIFCLRRKKWAFWLGSVVSINPLFWIGGIVFAFTGGRKVWPKAAASSPAVPPPLPAAVSGARTPGAEPAPFLAVPPALEPAAVAPPQPSPAPPPAVAAALPSQADYLVHDGTHQYGPMSLEKLRGQVADGWLSREHLYWHQAQAAWKPLAELGV